MLGGKKINVIFYFLVPRRQGTVEEVMESPSFPGVLTLYRKHLLDASVRAADAELLTRLRPRAPAVSKGARKNWSYRPFQTCV